MLTVEVGVLVACLTELGGSVAATVAAALVDPDTQLHGCGSGSTMKPIKSRSKGLFPSSPSLSRTLPSSPSNPPMFADSKHQSQHV